MHLRTYLASKGLTDAAFAAAVNASTGAVRKWKAGERTPRPEQMVEIVKATNGEVTPNDFLPIRKPAPASTEAA